MALIQIIGTNTKSLTQGDVSKQEGYVKQYKELSFYATSMLIFLFSLFISNNEKKKHKESISSLINKASFSILFKTHLVF